MGNGQYLVFNTSGVCNLEDSLQNTHRLVLASLKSAWEDMQNDNELSSPFGAASFVDLTVFAATARRFRRLKKKRQFSTAVADLWNHIRWALVRFTSASLDHRATHLVRTVPDIENRMIPSRKKRKQKTKSGQLQLVPREDDDNEQQEDDDDAPAASSSATTGEMRQWVQVDLNEIWNLYTDSVQVKGLSLQQIVRSKSRNREVGCKEATVLNWLGKIQVMYKDRVQLAFRAQTHINVIADASRHATRDTLVSAFYSADLNCGAYALSQKLKTAKTFPGEIPCSVAIERLLAQKKAERLSAYRLCQGLSHQLKHLTGGTLRLSSFLCNEPALTPLSPNKLRVLTGGSVHFVDKSSRESTCLNLDDLLQKPILVIGMDQGPAGMAAVAYLHQKAMIQSYFDVYHRIARDMKGAVTCAPRAVKSRFQRAQLASTYLWSLSYRPFRQGSFHQDKEELLESFLNSETQDRTWSQ